MRRTLFVHGLKPALVSYERAIEIATEKARRASGVWSAPDQWRLSRGNDPTSKGARTVIAPRPPQSPAGGPIRDRLYLQRGQANDQAPRGSACRFRSPGAGGDAVGRCTGDQLCVTAGRAAQPASPKDSGHVPDTAGRKLSTSLAPPLSGRTFGSSLSVFSAGICRQRSWAS